MWSLGFKEKNQSHLIHCLGLKEMKKYTKEIKGDEIFDMSITWIFIYLFFFFCSFELSKTPAVKGSVAVIFLHVNY